MTVYGESKVIIQYRVRDLLWRPAGRLVRFVVVMHPTRGACILMCTDTSLSAVDIIHLYGLRFKIECSFKQAVRQIGSFAYHFWMKDMTPLRHHNGNQYLHRKSADYRDRVKRKMRAYHAFIQAGVVAQGLLQYLALVAPKLVWNSFGSWLRTIRPASAIRICRGKRVAPDTSRISLLAPAKKPSSRKFIAERRTPKNADIPPSLLIPKLHANPNSPVNDITEYRRFFAEPAIPRPAPIRRSARGTRPSKENVSIDATLCGGIQRIQRQFKIMAA